LYRHKTWSLTLRKEQRLRVFENGMLRICGPKRDARKKQEDEESCIMRSLYSSPNIIKMIKSRRTRWVEHVASM
jgi:hypothetical protein